MKGKEAEIWARFTGIPTTIPPGTSIIAADLDDGNLAVKVCVFDSGLERLYAVYTCGGMYLGELLTLAEVIQRRRKLLGEGGVAAWRGPGIKVFQRPATFSEHDGAPPACP